MSSITQSHKYLAARVPSIELESSRAVLVGKPLLPYVLIISLCAFPLGWDLGTTGNLMDLPSFRARLGVSAEVTGLLISVFNLGCMGACVLLFFTHMSRHLGHLTTFRSCILVFLVGSVISFCGLFDERSSIYLYAFGRAIQGVSAGALCVIGPVYIDHLCTFSSRTIVFFALFQIMIGVFVLFGNCVFIYTGTYSELVFCSVSMLVPICALACLQHLPESPRDPTIVSDPKELKKSLTKIIADADLAEVWVCAVHVLKSYQIEEKEDADGHGMNKLRLFVCCLLLFLQQMTGAMFFFYFGKTMLDLLLVMNTPMKLSGLLLSVCNLAGTVVSGFLVSLKGARKPLFAGLVVLSILLFAFATMGALVGSAVSNQLGVPMLVTACCFLFVFAMTWGPCTAVLSIEICQADERILSCAVICGWFTNVLVISLFPVLVEQMGLGAMYIFLVFTVALIWATRKDFYHQDDSPA